MSTFLHYMIAIGSSLVVGFGGGFYIGLVYGKKAATTVAGVASKL